MLRTHSAIFCISTSGLFENWNLSANTTQRYRQPAKQEIITASSVFSPFFFEISLITNATRRSHGRDTTLISVASIERQNIYCTHWMKRVQHRLGGMRDGAWNRGGMRDTRNIDGGIRYDKILSRSGCAHFNWWDAGLSFEILGGIRDLNRKWPFESLTRRDGINILKVAGWSQNYWRDAGFKKPVLDPQWIATPTGQRKALGFDIECFDSKGDTLSQEKGVSQKTKNIYQINKQFEVYEPWRDFSATEILQYD